MWSSWVEKGDLGKKKRFLENPQCRSISWNIFFFLPWYGLAWHLFSPPISKRSGIISWSVFSKMQCKVLDCKPKERSHLVVNTASTEPVQEQLELPDRTSEFENAQMLTHLSLLPYRDPFHSSFLPTLCFHHHLTGWFKSQSEPAGPAWQLEAKQDLMGGLRGPSASGEAANGRIGIKLLDAQQPSGMLFWLGRGDSS